MIMKSIPGKIMSFVLAVGVYSGVKYGIGFYAADVAVEQSKDDSWPTEEKADFIKKCSSQASKEYANTLKSEIKNVKILYTMSELLGDEYCKCGVDFIEADKVIPTKRNKSRSIASHYKEVEELTSKWMRSEKGKIAIQKCDEYAVSKLDNYINEYLNTKKVEEATY